MEGYEDQREKHIKLVTDLNYAHLFCTFEEPGRDTPDIYFVRGKMIDDSGKLYEFMYKIGKHNFDLRVDNETISTPYYNSIYGLQEDKILRIHQIYSNHVITMDDICLFSGYPSRYATDGRCSVPLFNAYLQHVIGDFNTMLDARCPVPGA
jgi:hypothetical protein